MKWRKIVSGFLLSILFLIVLFFALNGFANLIYEKKLFIANLVESSKDFSKKESPLSLIDFKEQESEAFYPKRNWEIQPFNLKAKAAIVVETNLKDSDKILFSENITAKVPIASLTKLMTAVVAVENYQPSQTIKIDEKITSEKEGRAPLQLDKVMRADDLLYILLIESSNQAALALAEIMGEKEFVKLMNKKAQELSMFDTFFAEPAGLSPQTLSTAQDLLKLAKYILQNHPEIARISRIKEYNLPGYGKLENTDQLLGEISEIVAGKTGFTLEAKGCLMILLTNSKRDSYLIYIILGAEDRFTLMKELIDWVNRAYQW